MPTKEARAAMLEKLIDSLPNDKITRYKYQRVATAFLDYVGYHELTRDNLQKYFEYLRQEKGYADGTIRWNWAIIRKLFTANKLEWPFRNREAPVIRESNRRAPALRLDLICQYIKNAKAGKISAQATAFLALSTTYGLRPQELSEVRQADFDYTSLSILVRTAKHGRERWHKLPEEIVPYVQKYDWPPVSYHWVRKAYCEIEATIGRGHLEETGFHAIRRTLITEVGRYCQQLVVHRFFRWADTSMEEHYTAANYVGFDSAEQHDVIGQDESSDSIVFEHHPFVRVWGDKV